MRHPLDTLRGPKGKALALLVTLAAGYGIGKVTNNSSPDILLPSRPAAEGAAIPGQEQSANAAFDQREREVKGSIQTEAVELAQVVLDRLADSNSGAEAYKDKTGFVNKAAIVGPDLEYPTADDENYRGIPEMFARVEKDGKIIISATKETGEGPTAVFDSVDLVFDPAQPVDTDGNGEISLSELRDAVGKPDTTFEAADLGDKWGFNEQTKTEMGRRYGIHVGERGIVTSPDNGFQLIGNALQDTQPDTREGSDTTIAATVPDLDAVERDFKSVTEAVQDSLKTS